MSQPTIKSQYTAYVKPFNTQNLAEYSKFWAEDLSLHIPSFPPVQGRENVVKLLCGTLGYIVETLHPTFLICDLVECPKGISYFHA
jgi:ketosteroid isomerase-like protein